MIIYYRDEIGTNAAEVNEHGLAFDHENGNALFEDENDREYIIPIRSIVEISPASIIPLF